MCIRDSYCSCSAPHCSNHNALRVRQATKCDIAKYQTVLWFFLPTDGIFRYIPFQTVGQYQLFLNPVAWSPPVIKRIERTVWLNVFALGHMQINHCCSNFRMPQQFFKGNNIEPIFEQVGGVTVPE